MVDDPKELEDALERAERYLSPPNDPEWLVSEEVLVAARRWLAASRGDPEAVAELGGEEVVVRQDRLGETVIHMAGNPMADAADNLKSGVYRVFGPLGGDDE